MIRTNLTSCRPLTLSLVLVCAAIGVAEDAFLPPPAPPTTSPSITVAILPDRTGGPESGIPILRRAVQEIELLSPDFVINVGDMINGYTWSADRWLAETAEYKEIVSILERPWFPTAGNHDVFAGLRSSTERYNETLYRQHFGPLWYSYSFRGVHFVHLYSDLALSSKPKFGDEQIAWLREDMAANGTMPTFVFVHKPAWAYGAGEEWEPIHEILKGTNTRAVIAGHFHAYQKCAARDGIDYYILGAAGGFLHKPEHGGGFHHFMWLTIRDGEYDLAVVKIGGIEPDDFVTREDYTRIDANGSYGNRKLRVQGVLPEPGAEGARGQVTVHLANMGEEPQTIVVTVADEPWSGWRLAAPAEVLLQPQEELDLPIVLEHDAPVGLAVTAPKLHVTFPVVDAKGREVRPFQALRVPLEKGIELGAQGVAVLQCENWYPSYREMPGDPVPHVIVSLGADTVTFHASFPDPDLAHHGDQKAGSSLVSDAFEVMVGSRTLRVFPFGGEALATAWLDRGEGFEVAEGVGVTTLPAERGVHGYVVRVPRSLLDLTVPEGQESRTLPLNVILHDNDFTGYTTSYQWMRQGSDAAPAGTLVLTR